MTQEVVDTVTAPTDASTLQTPKQLYAFRHPEEVQQFIEEHPFLASLLVEAHDRIACYFMPRPDLVLQVVTDPESNDDRELFAFIRTDFSSDEALSRLNQLDQDWWLEASDRADGKLCIHVELI